MTRDPYKWDKYFFKIAKAVAENSSCMSRQIGAVLTRGKSIIATGYNGTPAHTPHCDERYDQDQFLRKELLECLDESEWDRTKCPRRLLGYPSGSGLYLCPATHAEANCICNAAKMGVSTIATTMYMTCGIPCKDCLSLLINAGVDELVVTSMDHYDNLSRFLCENFGMHIRVLNAQVLSSVEWTMATLITKNGHIFELDDADYDRVIYQGRRVRDLSWWLKTADESNQLISYVYGGSRVYLLQRLFNLQRGKNMLKYRDGNEKNLRRDNVYIEPKTRSSKDIITVTWCPFGLCKIFNSAKEDYRARICRRKCLKMHDEKYELCLNESAKRIWRGWERIESD